MKISYRFAVAILFVLYLLPILGIWILVETRIHERQVAPHVFLQNQIDVDRKILHVRATLAAPIFEASYENRSEISRRWSPGQD